MLAHVLSGQPRPFLCRAEVVFLRSYASGQLEQEQVLRVAETDLRKQQRKKSEKRAEIKKGERKPGRLHRHENECSATGRVAQRIGGRGLIA